MPVTAPTTPAGPASSVTPQVQAAAQIRPRAGDFLTENVASVVARRELAVYTTPDFSPQTDTGERLAARDKVRVVGVATSAAVEPRLQIVGGFISAASQDVRRPALRGPNADASVAVDLTTGEILWQDSANTKRRIASITKLLSVYLVLDWLEAGEGTWQTRVIMDDANLVKMSKDWNTGGFVFKRGRGYSVRDLYTLSVVESSNAAITALGIEVAGSNEAFLDEMNAKAKQIGMKSSKFISVSGLDNPSLKQFGLVKPGTKAKAGNISTAADVARLVRALLTDYPDVLDTSAITKTTVRGKKVRNTNQMLPGGRFYDAGLAIDGLKTGYTSRAGYCLAATSAKPGHHPVAIVVLGAKNSKARFAGTARLLHSIYDRWSLRDAPQ
jgi:D-alanyl-D-alanine carboxypeptidase (penicillin-binding protein 5/6)